MKRVRRWDPCVAHHGSPEVRSFISTYFSTSDRRVLLIAGAGFDPRSTEVAKLLASTPASIHAVFLKENRPDPAQELVSRAESNTAELDEMFAQSSLQQIEIFGSDGAVVGGRKAVEAVAKLNFRDVSDFVVDLSALSVGTSFPIIRYLVTQIEKGGGLPNLHIFVAHNPQIDTAIRPIPSDAPSYVHGFRGQATLDSSSTAAKLWLPQLSSGRRGALNRLFAFLDPHDTCPILPFPSSDPRLGDRLAEEFITEIESSWSVDTRNIVYAAEEDPLDLYRTILRLDDFRKLVFREVGGSLVVLSPLGSKLMALGALMAALERDLPVAYLESVGYSLDETVSTNSPELKLIHIWLEGDVYPQPRPPLL